jgi:hypothetical protein
MDFIQAITLLADLTSLKEHLKYADCSAVIFEFNGTDESLES